MNKRHFEILKEMINDFNEYSTDYTKTRCREIEQVLIDTLDYIINLQEAKDKLQNDYQEAVDKINELRIQLSATEEVSAEYIKRNDKLQEELEESEEAVKYWQNKCDLRQRTIDKALEYIKENCGADNRLQLKIILKGSDKDE